jgi:hypothetical protein
MSGECSIQLTAAHGATDDEVVRAPAVVGALAVGGEGAAEIGGAEGGDLLGDAELYRGGVERRDRLADLAEQLVLALQLVVAMGVEAADAGEEALRDWPSAACALISLATICSCWPRPLPGKGVVSVLPFTGRRARAGSRSSA